MKSLIAAVAALSVLFVGACRTPSSDAPRHLPGKLSGSFWAWIEDADGNEIVHDVTITIDAFANSADGERDPRWVDTGLPAKMPLEMIKRAPYNQPIYWDPGQTVIMAVSVIFEDAQLGDKVECWQDDETGAKKLGSDRSTVRQLPGRGTISVNCNFIFR